MKYNKHAYTDCHLLILYGSRGLEPIPASLGVVHKDRCWYRPHTPIHLLWVINHLFNQFTYTCMSLGARLLERAHDSMDEDMQSEHRKAIPRCCSVQFHDLLTMRQECLNTPCNPCFFEIMEMEMFQRPKSNLEWNPIDIHHFRGILL